MLQQLLAATTSLQESVKNIDNTVNEVKSQQHDMRSNIDQLEKAVFNTDIHGTRSNKQRHGHALEVLNEEGILNGGSDNDDGSNTNSSNSTHDDGNITNSNTTPDDGNGLKTQRGCKITGGILIPSGGSSVVSSK